MRFLVSSYVLSLVGNCVPRCPLVLCSFILCLPSVTWSRSTRSVFLYYITVCFRPIFLLHFLFFSIFVFLDVFSRAMWSELSHVQDPSLRLLANKSPEVVLSARADNATGTYLNGFRRWRSWAPKFPEISVLPATPAYVSLYLLSVLQASTSPAPVQTALYSIRWPHDLNGFQSPKSHTLTQKVWNLLPD